VPWLGRALPVRNAPLTGCAALEVLRHRPPFQPNYIAQISGQAANPATRNDCGTYLPFRPTGTASPGQVKGTGRIYPAAVPTVAGQLTAAGKT
jgi:hypothetical protein